MGYVRLKQLIEQNAWREAGRELGQYMNGEWDDELAVLAATVFSALGDWEGAYTCIAQGLQYNYRNYELYLLLGNYYERKNCNQAWLCYENALYYCSDEDDRRIIQQHKERVQHDDRWCVHKVSIVILTYNLKDMNMQCIGSIRDTCDPSSMSWSWWTSIYRRHAGMASGAKRYYPRGQPGKQGLPGWV